MNLLLKITSAIAVLIWSTTTLCAESEKQAIASLFSNYMAKYNQYINSSQLPLEPILYAEHVLVMSDSRPPKFYSGEQLHSQIQQFLTALKVRGVTHVNWQKVDIHLLGEHMALASNIAIRRDKNADIVDVVGASYTLYKQEQGWRIVAFAIHSADTAFIPQT